MEELYDTQALREAELASVNRMLERVGADMREQVGPGAAPGLAWTCTPCSSRPGSFPYLSPILIIRHPHCSHLALPPCAPQAVHLLATNSEADQLQKMAQEQVLEMEAAAQLRQAALEKELEAVQAALEADRASERTCRGQLDKTQAEVQGLKQQVSSRGGGREGGGREGVEGGWERSASIKSHPLLPRSPPTPYLPVSPQLKEIQKASAPLPSVIKSLQDEAQMLATSRHEHPLVAALEQQLEVRGGGAREIVCVREVGHLRSRL